MSRIDGLDPEAVDALSAALRNQAQALTGIAQGVDGLVEHTGWIWRGPRSDEFAAAWRQQHRPQLQAAVEALEGLARSAANNADEQRQVSGLAGASGSAHATATQGSSMSRLRQAVDTVGLGLGVVGLGMFGRSANGVGRYTARYRSLASTLGASTVRGWQQGTSRWADLTHYKRSAVLQHLQGSPVLRGLDRAGDRLDDLGGKSFDLLGKGFAIKDGIEVASSAFDHADDGDVIGVGTSVADGASIAMKQSKNPVAYLGGVTVSIWSENVKAAREIDWDQGVPSPWAGDNWNEVWVPAGKDAVGQVGRKLPKIFL